MRVGIFVIDAARCKAGDRSPRPIVSTVGVERDRSAGGVSAVVDVDGVVIRGVIDPDRTEQTLSVAIVAQVDGVDTATGDNHGGVGIGVENVDRIGAPLHPDIDAPLPTEHIRQRSSVENEARHLAADGVHGQGVVAGSAKDQDRRVGDHAIGADLDAVGTWRESRRERELHRLQSRAGPNPDIVPVRGPSIPAMPGAVIEADDWVVRRHLCVIAVCGPLAEAVELGTGEREGGSSRSLDIGDVGSVGRELRAIGSIEPQAVRGVGDQDLPVGKVEHAPDERGIAQVGASRVGNDRHGVGDGVVFLERRGPREVVAVDRPGGDQDLAVDFDRGGSVERANKRPRAILHIRAGDPASRAGERRRRRVESGVAARPGVKNASVGEANRRPVLGNNAVVAAIGVEPNGNSPRVIPPIVRVVVVRIENQSLALLRLGTLNRVGQDASVGELHPALLGTRITVEQGRAR